MSRSALSRVFHPGYQSSHSGGQDLSILRTVAGVVANWSTSLDSLLTVTAGFWHLASRLSFSVAYGNKAMW